MSDAILGISAFYHDSAAALLLDGDPIAAAQEERFTRKKHDSSFPGNAVQYVLEEAGLELNDLEAVAFYEKPYIKYERLLETYHAFAPRGLTSFLAAIPVWIKEKLFLKRLIRKELSQLGNGTPPLLFPEHHLSHAASAFYPSPFEESAILTIDAVGEWATTTVGYGAGNKITLLKELHFPHSVGLLYSAFTYYVGFKVNSGEYKLMGLAPYGDPDSPETNEFRRKILSELVDIREDGSLLLNMDYFRFATGLTMTHNKNWEQLFGIPRRESESAITQSYMNLSLAIQQITEDIILRLAATTKRLTESKNLVLAGGVTLNSVANGKLLQEYIFDNLWIQPAAGDAGGALGAALASWYIWRREKRNVLPEPDGMKGAFLGPKFNSNDIVKVMRKYRAIAKKFDDMDELSGQTAHLIADGKVVGWFQGRMEYGPRALGNRSILGDARNPDMQQRINEKIKFRESFRPFAPTVLEEDIDKYFMLDRPSPYMLLVVSVKEERRKYYTIGNMDGDFSARLKVERSDIPSVTHVDYSARVQSVNREANPLYWKLIREFKKQTGYGVIVNTSFNVRGEPIVCTPEDAYRCFMRTEMDYLVIENYLFEKKDQPVNEQILNKKNIEV